MMDFHPSHQTAIKLAGTVALPSPFPAFGALHILVAPEDGDYETYLRIVQHVTGKRIVTRFVRLADVRAIKAPANADAAGSPETWDVIGPKDIQREIAKKEKELRAEAAKSGIACESEWLPGAIVYVPEAAPVLHRNDVGVTAAVSAEEVAFSELHDSRGHCAIRPGAFAFGGKFPHCPGH
jgi:hypothetical protein